MLKIKNKNLTTALALIILTGFITSTLAAFFVFEFNKKALEEKAQERIVSIKSNLEKVFFKRHTSTLALEAFVASESYPLLDQQHQIEQFKNKFHSFVQSIEENIKGVISLQLAPEAIVTFVTNKNRNAKAISHDLLVDDKRRDQVLSAIHKRDQVVVGPLTLIQGGNAIIARKPIFADKTVFSSERYIDQGRALKSTPWLKEIPKDFWGLATVLIDTDSLFKEAGLKLKDEEFNYAIRGKHGLGADGDIFYGDETTFEQSLATISVQIVGGTWVVSASPTRPIPYNIAMTIFIISLIFTIILAYAVHYYFSNQALLISEQALKDKHLFLEQQADDREQLLKQVHEQKENAEKANQAKSQFLSIMSHELRTPMNAVIGYTNLLQQSSPNEKQQNYIQIILNASDSLMMMIKDILDFSHIEGGNLQAETIKFNLSKTLEPLMQQYTQKAQECDLNFSFIKGNFPNILNGSPENLKRILSKVIDNAIKFNKKGGSVTIEMNNHEQTEETITAQFIISDTGIGISNEQMGILFQPFTQADSSDTRQYDGVGLGLPLTKALLEAINGEIIVESEYEKGTTIYINIPFQKDN